MKTIRVNGMLSLFFLLTGLTVSGQQRTGEVPGDHFSLEGALELFKKSGSPQEFEQLLNSQSAKVNNLDLNGDGDIDYIKVIDRNEDNVHIFILQAIVSPTESQDVAVIELEKLGNGKAVLQITGDADIYGIETIIEPTEEVRINAGASTYRNVVNVWAWPSVQYVYSPYYTGWYSPWQWNLRPVWWSPWRPVSYYSYNPWWDSYRPYYSSCYTHRVVYGQHMYRPYRSTSVVVYNRHHEQINHYRSSHHDSNYSRGRDDERDRDRVNSGRQDQNTYQLDTDRNANGRQRTVYGQSENSRSIGRSSTNDWSNQQNQDNNRRRSSIAQNESFSRERINTDVKRESTGSQRDISSLQRQRQEPKQWSGVSNFNTDSRQREIRPSHDAGSSHRSMPIQPERKSTSVSPNLQRSGNDGGGNKSSVHKRGRD